MKKLIVLTFIFAALFSLQTNAQLKIGYVDSDTIMGKLPDAQDAQKKLDALIAGWQDEIDKMQKDWQAKYDDYQKRKLIMSDQKRSDTEKELVALEDKISNFRKEKFGPNGELFKKQTELMEPIQNKVFNIIQQVAEEEDLDFVFDRSGDIVFLYAKDKYDITPLVLEKLQLQ